MIARIIHPAVRMICNKVRESNWYQLNDTGSFYSKWHGLYRTSNIFEKVYMDIAESKSRGNANRIAKVRDREEAIARVVKAGINDSWSKEEPKRGPSISINTTPTTISAEVLFQAYDNYVKNTSTGKKELDEE